MNSAKIPRSLLANRRVSEPSAHVRVNYIENTELQPWLSSSSTQLMTIVSFGHTPPFQGPSPVIELNLPQIASSQICEVWTSDRPVQIKTDAGISTAMNGECLIGSINLDEKPGISLDAIAYRGYREVLVRLKDWGYPYLWRVWNYFPRINENQDGLERYRRFC
ncbi:MAG: hypothetical protein OEY28_04710, partial [Nitrospira sp.]|nr:hypothetical protein [Nitrospira sp.]